MARDLRLGLEILGPVNEGTACQFVAERLVDLQGNPITDLTGGTIVAQIFDAESKHQFMPETPVLDENGGVFDAGTFTLMIPGNLQGLVDQRKELENHILLLHWTLPGGIEGYHSVIIQVRNLARL